MRACAYIRVSTDDQNTSMQHDAIKRYAEYHQIEIDIFEEKESGAKRERPVLNKMMKLISEKKYSRMVVYKLDRIARSTLHFAQITEELKANGCDFVSVTEGIDFSTDVGQMVANILAVIADFERKTLIRRTKDGMSAAKSRGKRLGKAPKPLPIDDIKRLIKRGLKVDNIAKQFGLSRSQLYRRLSLTPSAFGGK